VIVGTAVSLAKGIIATSMIWANTGNTILQNPDNDTSHLKSVIGFSRYKILSTIQGQDWPPICRERNGVGSTQLDPIGKAKAQRFRVDLIIDNVTCNRYG
jgi:hypothetical protein